MLRQTTATFPQPPERVFDAIARSPRARGWHPLAARAHVRVARRTRPWDLRITLDAGSAVRPARLAFGLARTERGDTQVNALLSLDVPGRRRLLAPLARVRLQRQLARVMADLADMLIANGHERV